ncbi:hypothetical protein PYCCODRAFT_1469700 [Trametes coccinea BRFM310]|uniref:Uncharacterized protein n=1 Tax=Trametes coccinea (strain BRFM310) TaxID=1353009 RepID=A0A1Y2IG82_TRAC3|nr:hypothetical protein PYCCODRAFT_1469700 [Trametes coccinea BRFM310]
MAEERNDEPPHASSSQLTESLTIEDCENGMPQSQDNPVLLDEDDDVNHPAPPATPPPSTARRMTRQTSAMHLSPSKRKRTEETTTDSPEQSSSAKGKQPATSRTPIPSVKKAAAQPLREQLGALTRRVDYLAQQIQDDRSAIPALELRVTDTIANVRNSVITETADLLRTEFSRQMTSIQSAHNSVLDRVNSSLQSVRSASNHTPAVSSDDGVPPPPSIPSSGSAVGSLSSISGPAGYTGTILDLPVDEINSRPHYASAARLPYRSPRPPEQQAIVQSATLRPIPPAPSYRDLLPPRPVAPYPHPDADHMDSRPNDFARPPLDLTVSSRLGDGRPHNGDNRPAFASHRPRVPSRPSRGTGLPRVTAPPSRSAGPSRGSLPTTVLLGPLGWESAFVREQVLDVAEPVFLQRRTLKQHLLNVSLDDNPHFVRLSYSARDDAAAFVQLWTDLPRKDEQYTAVHAHL